MFFNFSPLAWDLYAGFIWGLGVFFSSPLFCSTRFCLPFFFLVCNNLFSLSCTVKFLIPVMNFWNMGVISSSSTLSLLFQQVQLLPTAAWHAISSDCAIVSAISRPLFSMIPAQASSSSSLSFILHSCRGFVSIVSPRPCVFVLFLFLLFLTQPPLGTDLRLCWTSEPPPLL